MSSPRAFTRVAAAAAALALLLLGALPTAALAEEDTADGYPSWREVRQAQASEQATQAEYERLQQALQRAQDESAAASVAAVSALRAATEAQTALDQITEREQEIAARLELDAQHLQDSSGSLAQIVSFMYRGSGSVGVTSQVMFEAHPDEFIAKYGSALQVSGSWNTQIERALESVNAAEQLREQAAQVRQTRQTLSAEAGRAAQAATDSQRRAEAAVTAAVRNTDTVYAQLATLRGTTAAVEREYQLGLQVAAQPAPPEPTRPGSGGSGGSGGSVNIGGGVIVDAGGAQAYAADRMSAYGWGGEQMSCLIPLWNGESGWRADALNPYSGAYGIPQSLPAEKMATAGPDWRTNGRTQVDWGLAYIRSAYGSPCAAWSKWQARSPHWY